MWMKTAALTVAFLISLSRFILNIKPNFFKQKLGFCLLGCPLMISQLLLDEMAWFSMILCSRCYYVLSESNFIY